MVEQQPLDHYILFGITKMVYLITSTLIGDIHVFLGQRQVTFILVKGGFASTAAFDCGNTFKPKVLR